MTFRFLRRLMAGVPLCSLVLFAPMAFASFTAEPSTISVPEGPGSIQGMGETFDVSPNTGLASYGFGLPLPEGAGKFSPSVSFSYSSGAPNGVMGVGWSLNEARICRSSDAGVPRYAPFTVDDAYTLQGVGGHGRLVEVPEWANTGGAASWLGLRDVEAWVRVRPAPTIGDGQGWLVERPDGVITYYGTSAATREGVATDSFSGTYCWSLERETNPWDRTIRYSYRREGGRLLLASIRYGEPGAYEHYVEFLYETRRDVLGDWRAGYLREHTHRLVGVRVKVGQNGRTLTSMDFSYEERWNTSRLVRAEVTGEFGEALPAHRFDYGVFDTSHARVRTMSAPGIVASGGGYHLVDIDGDSFVDLVRANAVGWSYYRNLQGGSFESTPRSIQNPPSFVGTAADWTFMDMDGDGLRDIVFRSPDGSLRGYRNVSPSSGGSASFEYVGELGVATSVPLNDPNLRLLDLNLDRRIDVLLAQSNGALSSSLSSVTPDVDGLVRSSSPVLWDGLRDVSTRTTHSPASGRITSFPLATGGVHLGDMNGDGLDDIVRFMGGAGQTTSIWVYPSRGQGIFDEGYALAALPARMKKLDPSSLRVLDVNRDGLGDVIWVGQSEVRLWMNVGGTTFSTEHVVSLPSRSSQSEVYLEDIDADGVVDFVVIDPTKSAWQIVDISGGLRDDGLLRSASNGMGGTYAITYQSLADASEIAQMEGTPWSAWIPQPMRVAGESVVSDSRGWTALTRRIFRDPAWDRNEGSFRGFRSATVVQEGDDEAESRVTDYVFYTGIGREARDLGAFWGRPQGNFGAADLRGLSGRPRSVVRRTADGLLLAQELYVYEWRELSAYRDYFVTREVVSYQPEGAVLAPPPGELVGESSLWTAAPRREEAGERNRWIRRTLSENDDYGNLTRNTELGYVGPDGSDISGDERITLRKYTDPLEQWRVGLSYEESILDGQERVLSRTQTFYDGEAYTGLPAGRVEKGAVSRIRSWYSGQQRWVDVARMDVDAKGNARGVLDALGHYASIEYDRETQSYPVRETLYLTEGAYAQRRNPRGPEMLSVSADYDFSRGLVKSVTDFNGQTTYLHYDGLGREVSRVLPGDTEALPTQRFHYEFGETTSRLFVESRERSGTQETLGRWVYVDGLGRSLVTVEGAPGRAYSATGYQRYNVMGDVAEVLHDFDVASDVFPSAAPSNIPKITQSYDALGRQVFSILEDGARLRAEYRPGEEWSYDPNDMDPGSPHYNTPTIRGRDGLGREVYTRLTLDASGQYREYRSTWDARDLLLSRELPDGTKRLWAYDSLGRRERVSDPNAGTSFREYDDIGNVVSQSNAMGETLFTSYDALGRIVDVRQAQDPGSAREVVASYLYDVAADVKYPANNALGRLVSRTEEAFTTYLDYDARGQNVRIFRELDGKVYTQGTLFDAMGRPEKMVFADGSQMGIAYDHRSRVVSMTEIIQRIAYKSDGTVESILYGNDVRRTHEYDDRLRLRHYGIDSAANESLLDLSMDYDAAGVPLRLIDHLHADGPLSQSKAWDYDALYRPEVMQSPSLGRVEYQFNEANNLISRVVLPTAGPVDLGLNLKGLNVGEFRFGVNALEGLSAGPHQVTQVADRTLGYDPAGQMVQDRRTTDAGSEDRHFYWDPSGRLARIGFEDGRTIRYAYDGGFVRTERRHVGASGESLERTVYLSPSEELEWKGRQFQYKKIQYLGSERVAEIRQGLDPGVPKNEFKASSEASWLAGIPSVNTDGPSSYWKRVDVWLAAALNRYAQQALLVLCVLMSLLAARVLTRSVRINAKRLTGRVAATIASLALVSASLPACGGDEVVIPSPPLIDATAVVVFYHAPLLGTPVLQTNRSGELHNRQVSTPFGTRVYHEGEDAEEFLFTGKLWDDDADIIYFGARYYDAELSIWLSPDPLALWGDDGSLSAFDLNCTAYVGGRVTIAVDLFGFEGAPGVSMAWEKPKGEQDTIGEYRIFRPRSGAEGVIGFAVTEATDASSLAAMMGAAIDAGYSKDNIYAFNGTRSYVISDLINYIQTRETEFRETTARRVFAVMGGALDLASIALSVKAIAAATSTGAAPVTPVGVSSIACSVSSLYGNGMTAIHGTAENTLAVSGIIWVGDRLDLSTNANGVSYTESAACGTLSLFSIRINDRGLQMALPVIDVLTRPIFTFRDNMIDAF